MRLPSRLPLAEVQLRKRARRHGGRVVQVDVEKAWRQVVALNPDTRCDLVRFERCLARLLDNDGLATMEVESGVSVTVSSVVTEMPLSRGFVMQPLVI